MLPRLLILGGTAEAAALAKRIDREFGAAIDMVSSLAGRMATLPDLPGRLRVGGFGGTEGLAAYLKQESVKAVIDATHPFARRISSHAAQACKKTGVPLAVLERPPWRQEPDDRWHETETMAEAARRLSSLGKRIFLTIGRMELDVFKPVTNVWCLVRLIDPPGENLAAHWHVVQGRPPFTVESEISLMREHRIDLLVSKASGGQATYGKILAARALDIPVLMIKRPPPSNAPRHGSCGQAAEWVRTVLFSPP